MHRIARHLHLAARTVKKYLQAPVPVPVHRPRPSKLDPFKPLIAEPLERDPRAPGAVILQRWQAAGYSSGHAILRDYLQRAQVCRSTRRAFVRMEPPPGARFEIDGGHFGALDYQGDKRKLYAFCRIEAHRRMLYVEFTHRQNFQTSLRCHEHAFQFLGGASRAGGYDNLLTLVAEHDGRLIRFNPASGPLPDRMASTPELVFPAPPGRRGKWKKPAGAISVTTCGPCAPSPIWPTLIVKAARGSARSRISAGIAKHASGRSSASVPTPCDRCRP
jgi:transposase